MIERVIDWLGDHAWVAAAATVGSVILLLATGAAAVWALGRLPADYLVRTGRGRRFAWAPAPARIALIAGKNILGWLLIALGLAMLALPGQGLLTVLVGVILVDLPGKRRLERAILCRPSVLKRINALRRRMGRQPLQHASAAEGGPEGSAAGGATICHGGETER